MRRNFSRMRRLKRAMKAYRDDIITEELYKETIMSRISVSEEEIESWLPQARKQIDLAWIYSVDEQRSLDLWQQLKDGNAFDSLFQTQLTDSVTEDERLLRSTIYKLQTEQPEIFAAIDGLPPGSQSKPVKGPDGWYIFKIRNLWTPVILTQSEEYKIKQELERSLFKKKLDRESDLYVNHLMDEEAPLIDRNGFSRIIFYLNTKAVTHTPFDRQILETKLNNDQLKEKSAPDYHDDENQIFVTGNTMQLSDRDFADWYGPRAVYLKMPSDSPENFILTAQRIVWRMVRDHLLIREAERKNYDNLPGVIAQTGWWEEKIVYNAVKADIANSVTYNENDLRDFYSKNLKNFRYASGEIIPYEKARDNVESELKKEIYMNKLMRRILDLKQKYTIQINENLLRSLELADEDDPRTIEFYAVKKGGLLPRQPYPTIDWEWQLWY